MTETTQPIEPNPNIPKKPTNRLAKISLLANLFLPLLLLPVGIALAAMVASEKGYMMLAMSLLLVLPMFGVVASIVMGHTALRQIKRTQEKGRGIAIIGLLFGYLGVLIWGALAVGVVSFFNMYIGTSKIVAADTMLMPIRAEVAKSLRDNKPISKIYFEKQNIEPYWLNVRVSMGEIHATYATSNSVPIYLQGETLIMSTTESSKGEEWSCRYAVEQSNKNVLKINLFPKVCRQNHSGSLIEHLKKTVSGSLKN